MLTNTPTLFDQAGTDLRDAGMKKAIEHADQVNEGWSDKAFNLLKSYVNEFGPGWKFLGEQVRYYAEAKKLEEPPSLRAWGSVMVRAAKSGLIKKVGYGQVTNPKAHRANSSQWEVIGKAL